MQIPHEPDEVVDHLPPKCGDCPRLSECRSKGLFSCDEKRYVVDAITITKVTEHRTMRAECPLGDGGTGTFPEDVRAHTQYGDSFTTIVGILDSYGAMSDQRISMLLRDLFGVSLSPGTVVAMTSKCAGRITPLLADIREKVIESKVTHHDETSLRVGKGHMWVHVSSNKDNTYLSLCEKRGYEGIEDNNVLPNTSDVAVHDCFSAYFNYDNVKHAVCCAHLLRELNAMEEMNPGHRWPGMFKDLLISMKMSKDDAISRGETALENEILQSFSDRYDDILIQAQAEAPPLPQDPNRRKGAYRRGPERALIGRLIDKKDCVCRFFHDFDVPFDNNQAERDLRFLKTKQKVSGCFRSVEGAKDHLTITSYLSTNRKQGIGAYNAMMAAMRGAF